MKKLPSWTLILGVLIFAPELRGQQASPTPAQPPFSEAEEVLILKALIDRDEFATKARELEKQVALADEQLRLAAERLKIERDMRLAEKKLHLAALQSLAAYRTTRRPRIVKILTFGIVRDKRDRILEAQIATLAAEIAAWQ